MSFFFKAEELEDSYRFEVCDAPPGRCQGPDDETEHRVYTWGKPADPMTPDDMVREVRLLEDARAQLPVVLAQLPEHGRPV